MSEYNDEVLYEAAEEAVHETEEDFAVRLSERFGISTADALDLIEEVQERFGTGSSEPLRMARKFDVKSRRAWHFLRSYAANQGDVNELRMGISVVALALGYHQVAGARNVTELARKLEMPDKKATVNKCFIEALDFIGLPSAEGQREDEARENMRQAAIARQAAKLRRLRAASTPPQL